jgi:hypothetical protein
MQIKNARSCPIFGLFVCQFKYAIVPPFSFLFLFLFLCTSFPSILLFLLYVVEKKSSKTEKKIGAKILFEKLWSA